MGNTREIVTKAVIGKGKKEFTDTKKVKCENKPDTILGCWVINHNFKGVRNKDKVDIDGTYDVNIWYSCLNDTKTDVIKDTYTYHEEVMMPNVNVDDYSNPDVIIRSLKQPICSKCDIDNDNIIYTIVKDLGIEVVGDIKVKIEYQESDPWIDIDDNKDIDNINEDFLNKE